jgi:LysM repeat protein
MIKDQKYQPKIIPKQMKTIFLLFVALVSVSFSGYSQANNIKHTVAKGETITQIAKKYNVTALEIYKLNPDAQSGLKPNSILLIPKVVNVTKTTTAVKPIANPKTHLVTAKETLFAIEKKYGITDEALKNANPDLEKNGLKVGQTLILPSDNKVKKTIPKEDNNKSLVHEVLPKETKYSIAKQYGMTIEELEKKNPQIVLNIPVGYKLLIKGAPSKKETTYVATVAPKIDKPKPTSEKIIKPIDFINYKVKPKETIYSLKRMFEISRQELLSLNPELENGLVEGMIIKVPSTAKIPVIEEIKKPTIVLDTKSNGTRRKLALLLPFNISKIESDTTKSSVSRLKKDKFLNMTLDFYAGALMAIDSAKQIGLKVDVQIYDSQETKNSSNVPTIIQDKNLEDMDAIIGPFYQNNIEKTADLLSKKDIPVISPLSKDLGNPYSNLYQTITTVGAVRSAMFDFMRAKQGNIIAVVDKKKESIRQYIKENQTDVQFANLTETGGLVAESLKSLFVKDKTNYVVMETGNTSLIKSTMSILLGAIATYNVQLVILEPNETLDTDEINFASLIKLKLMYPCMTRENESPEALIFERNFRKKNKIFPSSFATRGFDITFDTMMRLSQDKSFQETAENFVTEQVDNKFAYTKKEGGGYTNKGVYILYYDSDLTIKEAR